MKPRLKWYLIKFALILFRSVNRILRGFFFLFKYLRKPGRIFGQILISILFVLYKMYFLAKKIFLKTFLPSRNILGLISNKYIIHAVVLIIALAITSQNIYAYSSALGDYGKRSILFKLTKPADEEEVVEGLPIHSDIEIEVERRPDPYSPEITQTENESALGFAGGDYVPPGETAKTRSSIEYYIVSSGDTLGSIAQKFGISLNTILWANKITQTSFIRPGDKLTVLPTSGVAHAVKKGDTLAGIAKKYNAEQEKIIEFNHLADAGDLTIGQVLIIPGGKIIYTPPPPRIAPSGYATRTYVSSGQLFWPAPSKRITQYFSWRHPGIDVGMPSGSNVVASESGIVIYSGWGRGYGLQILIDHGNGIKTRYAHNSRLLVRAGHTIARGQVIALSGNTGWSTGPHLHFEVYINNVRQNPFLYTR